MNFNATDDPVGLAIADLNGDGMPDLVVGNHDVATVSVLKNTMAPGATTPTFAPRVDVTTGANPWCVALVT